jgi:hypothetical protein
MLQYSHDGKLLRKLDDRADVPSACAVNKANGDLAVANLEGYPSQGAGNITIFKNASGSGTVFTNSDIYEYFFVGYDGKGDLYFDGTNRDRKRSYFAEVAAGSSQTHSISLSGGTLHLAGFIQWFARGKYVALGDQECGNKPASCVYHVTVSGSTGTINATTDILNYKGTAACGIIGAVIDGESLAAGDDEFCGNTSNTVDLWTYPKGGAPSHHRVDAALQAPIGAAVSSE